ncbi:MAG: hypothetical protein JNL28_17055 [Planctomycetes bacterium]|nr:hypothetical protein [Planctomycetota bacterium]
MKNLLLVLVALFGLCGAARSQCQVADPRFFSDGTDGRIDVMRILDLGTGPQLYVGGLFNRIGDVPVKNLARWNGTTWEGFGSALNGSVSAITAWDDGTGTKLYVGGFFNKAGALTVNGVARWNGSTWSALGTGVNNGYVHALAVHDEGAGPKLFVGGDFANIHGIANGRYIGRWNGTAWSAVGLGANAIAYALASYDDGTGSALYVSGTMTAMGNSLVNDTPVNSIARWKGGMWSALGTGLNAYSRGLAVLDDGTGPVLYVGGAFSTAGGVPADRVAKWGPGGWSGVGFGLTGVVQSFALHDDGFGMRLYVCGPSIQGMVVKLDAGQWYALGTVGSGGVSSLVSWDDGSGTRLWAGGGFEKLGTTDALSLAKWDGSTWLRIHPGLGVYGPLDDITVHDDGTGPALYATSDSHLYLAGDVPVVGTIRRKNGAWSTVGFGPKGVALKSVASGPLAGLYLVGPQVAGDPIMSSGVAKWDGTAWSRVGLANMGGSYVESIAYFDDGTGPAIYVAGSFTEIGGINANRCAKWDGTSWTSVPNSFGPILDFAIYDDGGGEKLYGIVNSPQPVCVKLTPTGWQALSSPPPSASRRIAVYDDGAGAKLYCGGGATFVRWSGTAWVNLNVPGAVELSDFLVHDDGTGSALYIFARSVLKWTGAGASNVGIALTHPTQTVNPSGSTVFDEGLGPRIFVVGQFEMAERAFSKHVASFHACTTSDGLPFCFGDFTPGSNCPCSEVAAPLSGQGCPNSTGQGALLAFAGVCSITADTATLIGNRMPNGGALYFQGTTQQSGGNGVAFGDGKLCVSGGVIRLGVEFNVAGASQYPQGADLPISVQGQVVASGVRHYQVWYRDAATYCTVNTYNLSNGLTLLWGP